MERSYSHSSRGQLSNGCEESTPPLPPWEQKNMARVPYMPRHTQPLNEAEREALQSLWAANGQVKRATSRPRLREHGQQSFDSGYPSRQHREEKVPMPMSAPPFTSPRAAPPLPTPNSRKSQNLPQSTGQQLPPSPFTTMPPTPPPEATTSSNLSRSSTTTRSSSTTTGKSWSISSPGQSPRLPQHTVPSLPGTMSARDSVAVVRLPAPPPSSTKQENFGREEYAVKEEKEIEEGREKGKGKGEGTKPLGTRFKLALKDIFKREVVDESQFERIGEGRHWTDE